MMSKNKKKYVKKYQKREAIIVQNTRKTEIRIEEENRKRYEQRRERRRRKRRRQRRIRMAILLLTPLAVLGLAAAGIYLHRALTAEEAMQPEETKYIASPPDYQVELLTVNEYSRPGSELPEVKGIVIHYTANPGTTAEQNRNYFEGLAESGETHASSHFIIGLSGEIVQCIPCNEIAYASNERNEDTVSIECCIPDETGKFGDETYQSLVHLAAWLMGRYDLTADDIIRHYDVTGKNCPKYYVENEGEWTKFKEDLLAYIDMYGIAKTDEIQ